MAVWQYFSRYLIQFHKVLRHNTVILAVQESLAVLFPFVVIGALISTLRQSVFRPNGFFNQIYHISSWLPQYNATANFFGMMGMVVNGFLAIIVAYTVTSYIVHAKHRDSWLAGILSAISFIMLNVDPDAVKYYSLNGLGTAAGDNQETPSLFFFNNLGTRGIFMALIVGIIVAYIFLFLTSPERFNHVEGTAGYMYKRTRTVIIPAAFILFVAGLISLGIQVLFPESLITVAYQIISLPFKGQHLIFSFLGLSFLSNLFWVFGIIGPLNISGNNSILSLQNLQYALTHESAMNAPHPLTVHTVVDIFANMGGNGMTFALIIAIFIASRQQEVRHIARMSLIPGIVNINTPLLVGLPVMFNPILAIPFLLSPLVSIIIGWAAIRLSIIPPALYPVSGTTPGVLMSYIGTNGSIGALLVSLLNLTLAVLIYIPFVRMYNRAEAELNAEKGGDQHDEEV